MSELPTPLSTTGPVKRKKGGGKQIFHQSQSIALTTNIADDDDDEPLVRKRTIYTAVRDVETVEDTDTLARAAQLDGFTYLLGESIMSDEDQDLNDSGNLTVQVKNSRKYYNSTVRPFLKSSSFEMVN